MGKKVNRPPEPHVGCYQGSFSGGGHLWPCGWTFNLFKYNDEGCMNLIFQSFDFEVMCCMLNTFRVLPWYHELQSISANIPSPFSIVFRPCWAKTLPENIISPIFGVFFQNFTFPDCFPSDLCYSYYFSLLFLVGLLLQNVVLFQSKDLVKLWWIHCRLR